MAIEITRGSEVDMPFTWTDNQNVVKNGTGATIEASLRYKLSQKEIMVIPSAWTDAVNGAGVLNFEETHTAMVPIGCVSEIFIKIINPGDVTDVFTGGDLEGI